MVKVWEIIAGKGLIDTLKGNNDLNCNPLLNNKPYNFPPPWINETTLNNIENGGTLVEKLNGKLSFNRMFYLFYLF